MLKAVIFDIDGTLYDYDSANEASMKALAAYAAEQLGWELDQLMTETLAAMAATEDDVNAICAEFED